MRMKNNFSLIAACLLLFFISGSPSLGADDDEDGKWNKAGREMREATDAVIDASMDSSREAWRKTREESKELYEDAGEESAEIWAKTREKSGEVWETMKIESFEAWEKTKEESAKMYEQTRAGIHEATAPEPDAGDPDSAK